jgi:hypothetical protein
MVGAKGMILVISKRLIAVVLLLLSSCGIVRAATASGDAPKLIPMPREYSPRESFGLGHGVSVVTDSDPEDLFAAHDLSAFFEKLNLRKGHGTQSSNYSARNRAPRRACSRTPT